MLPYIREFHRLPIAPHSMSQIVQPLLIPLLFLDNKAFTNYNINGAITKPSATETAMASTPGMKKGWLNTR